MERLLSEVTELGKESIYITDKEIYRDIVYNQISDNVNNIYQLEYEESYTEEEGLRINLKLLTKDGTHTLYSDKFPDEELNGKEVDVDNIADFCINMLDSSSIPAGMSVSEGIPVTISLHGKNEKTKEFQLVPERDGTVFHLNDAILYTNYIVCDMQQDRTFSEHPAFYKNNMLAKIVYTNDVLVNKDYNNPNEILIFKDANILIDIKYNKVTELSRGNYKLTRLIQTETKVRNIVGSECSPGDKMITTKYNTLENNKFVITEDNPIQSNIIYEISPDNTEYTLIYPIHYVSILGNIVMDSKDYKIYAEESIIMDNNGNILQHDIFYHRLHIEMIKEIKERIK